MVQNLSISDIKVFVPAKDYQLSLSFYQQLGWKLNADHGNLAEPELQGVHRKSFNATSNLCAALSQLMMLKRLSTNSARRFRYFR